MDGRADIVELVKDTVSMTDILTAYGLPTGRHGRIPCPIHGGVKNNLAYKRDWFKCYVCGEKGDVFDFVQAYRGLDFRDALREIDGLFNLHLPLDSGTEIPEKALIEAARRRAERNERKKRRERLKSALDDALDRYSYMDIILMEDEPEGPLEGYSDQYVYAAKNIDRAWVEVEKAEGALHEFEKQQIEKENRR